MQYHTYETLENGLQQGPGYGVRYLSAGKGLCRRYRCSLGSHSGVPWVMGLPKGWHSGMLSISALLVNRPLCKHHMSEFMVDMCLAETLAWVGGDLICSSCAGWPTPTPTKI